MLLIIIKLATKLLYLYIPCFSYYTVTATCGAPGVRLANFADGNCRTHWDCENGHPHPVCCPDGQGFDVFISQCVPDLNCIHGCPKEYSRKYQKLLKQLL